MSFITTYLWISSFSVCHMEWYSYWQLSLPGQCLEGTLGDMTLGPGKEQPSCLWTFKVHFVPCSSVNFMTHYVCCRVFGHFEQPLFLELCRSVETKFVPAGAFLFRRGQPDDSIFVVQSGRLLVYITEPVMLTHITLLIFHQWQSFKTKSNVWWRLVVGTHIM